MGRTIGKNMASGPPAEPDVETFDPFGNAREQFERLPMQLINLIQNNDLNSIKKVLKSFNVKNVTWIKCYDEEQLRTLGKDIDTMSNSSSIRQTPKKPKINCEGACYNTAMWNPILYALFYQKTEIAKFLIEEYSSNLIMAVRMPPGSEFTEYTVPGG